jgi:hypothetical protein
LSSEIIFRTFLKIYSALIIVERTGGFLATTKPLDLRGTARCLANSLLPTPLHSPLSKALEAACPVHDTHAAGVVTQATKHIVVALKTPCAHAPLLYPILSLRSCRLLVFYALILGKVVKLFYNNRNLAGREDNRKNKI